MIDTKEGYHGAPTDQKRGPVLAGSAYRRRGHGIRTQSFRSRHAHALWLIFIAVVWIGLLAVYVLGNAVNRVVELLSTISQQPTMTPQKEGADG